ncbi:MAG: protein kinase [Acidobacteriota bacterium]|nr:protein kinase [Acidobacteriota bacterium]
MTTDLWRQCEGAIVAARYSLRRFLGNSSRGAAFVSESGEGGPQVVVKLIEADNSQPEALLANWSAVSKLSYPHLIRLFDSGRCEIAGTQFLYAVMEWAEDNLGGVLESRPLEEGEVREMLEPALLALDFLHSKGFVHSGIKPSNIMATEDRLLLASDSITPAGRINGSRLPGAYDPPEWKEGQTSPASDVWALGLTVLESFARRLPEGDAESMAGSLPGPFADIVRHSLARDPQERWTVAQIASRLRGEIAQGVGKSAPRTTAEKQRSKWVYPVWVYSVIGAALAALALFVLLGREHRSSPIPVEPKPVKSQTVASIPTPAPEAPLAPAQPPSSPKPNPFGSLLNRIPPRTVNSRPGGAGQVWYVVAATYHNRKDADKRAREISRRWPKFKAEVYAPPSGHGYYLVLLGSNVSQDEAARIQQRAVSSGLPRDTYIKKYPPE